jgi:autotransporter-associated beta strand protein
LAFAVAAHAQWLASPGTNAFGTTTNWTGGSINGTFNGPSTFTTLSVASAQILATGNYSISGATTPTYTLGLTPNAGSFRTFSGTSFTMASDVTTNQIVNAGYYQNGGTSSNQANPVSANSTLATLTFNSDYNNVNSSGTTTAGQSVYLNLGGTGGTGIWNGIVANGKDSLGNPVAGSVILKRPGSATWTLNGVNTYTGGTEFGNGGTGSTIINNKLAFSTGAFRVISGNVNIAASTPLTGADAIANTVNYVGNTATAVSNTYIGITAGIKTVEVFPQAHLSLATLSQATS